MAIDHVSADFFSRGLPLSAQRTRRFGEHDGMAVRVAEFCFQPDLVAMAHEPFGAGEQIFFMLRLRGDAGEAK